MAAPPGADRVYHRPRRSPGTHLGAPRRDHPRPPNSHADTSTTTVIGAHAVG